MPDLLVEAGTPVVIMTGQNCITSCGRKLLASRRAYHFNASSPCTQPDTTLCNAATLFQTANPCTKAATLDPQNPLDIA